MTNIFEILNVQEMDSPALAIYPSIVKSNIEKAVAMFGNSKLRPHVKTCKTIEVVKLMIDAGITKFKCATVAEAEMLALAGAKDVLIALQPAATAIIRIKKLRNYYPATLISCLVDNINSFKKISSTFIDNPLAVFIDINIGMNRTGVNPKDAIKLIEYCLSLPGIELEGIHAYDGHINDFDVAQRKQRADKIFTIALEIKNAANYKSGKELSLVIGGTPTFPFYTGYDHVECSPGTFFFGMQVMTCSRIYHLK